MKNRDKIKKELESKLNALIDEENLERVDKKRAHNDLVIKNIDAILALVPDHCKRNGCSDEHIQIGTGCPRCSDCVRCELLASKRDGVWYSNKIIHITLV